LQNKR